VKSYGEVLEEYEFHEEAKCADASGAPCGKQTVGLLQRRRAIIEWPPRCIGKESTKLEEVEEGSVPDTGDVYTEYPDPRCAVRKWDEALTALKTMTKRQLCAIQESSRISLTTLKAMRRGRSPRVATRERFLRWLHRHKE
jgi:hypothetical protein